LIPTPAFGFDVVYDGDGSKLKAATTQVGPFGGALFPGDDASPVSSGNNIVIDYSSGDDPDYVFGGIGRNESSSGNAVLLNRGTVRNSIFGAFEDSSVGFGSFGNSVTVAGDSYVGFGAYGAFSLMGDAYSGNTLVINGENSYVGGESSGGLSIIGNSMRNTAMLMAGTVNSISGGHSYFGKVSLNTMIINGGTVESSAYGGYSNDFGEVFDNSLVIDGATSVVRFASGGESNSGNVTNNRVNVKGGKVQLLASGGGSIDGSSFENSLAISGGYVATGYGGMSVNGDASGNSVSLNEGAAVNDLIGGKSYHASAVGNSVSIGTAEVFGKVLGGEAGSGAGDATGNTVTIGGRPTFGQYSSLIGGMAYDGDAVNNTLNIGGSPNFGEHTGLIGGISAVGESFSGNTIHLRNYSGSAVESIEKFAHYDFLLSPDMTGGIVATGYVMFAEALVSQNMATIDCVNALGGGRAPQLGERVPLVTAGRILGAPANRGGTLAGKKGATLDVVFRLVQTIGVAEPDVLYASVESARGSRGAKALSEGYLAGSVLVNQGADLMSGRGLAEATKVAYGAEDAEGGGGSPGVGVFAAAAGSRSRYETGSHADVTSFSVIAGISRSWELSRGRLALAVFFEYGNGSYGTQNFFPGSAQARGEGKARYAGGGIMGRLDFGESLSGHFHAEASARAGSVHNEFRTTDLVDSLGTSARGYGSTSGYFGMHMGLGYLFAVTDTATLDLYCQYLWTRQQGDSVLLDTLDPVRFDDVDSHRIRLGGRLSFKSGDHARPYIGAAYEYELDGVAKATTYGYEIEAPSVSGGTVMGELGISVTPSEVVPVSFEIGAQVFGGKRRGAAGHLTIKYVF
jgi:hypothetical protein